MSQEANNTPLAPTGVPPAPVNSFSQPREAQNTPSPPHPPIGPVYAPVATVQVDSDVEEDHLDLSDS